MSPDPILADANEPGKVATPARPGRKITIHANEGYGFPFPGNVMQVRVRSKSDIYVAVIQGELKRCGAPTRKIKVREFSGLLYLNIFYLRGLDPPLAIAALQKLPGYCGIKRVMAALEQLEQRVETGHSPINPILQPP